MTMISRIWDSLKLSADKAVDYFIALPWFIQLVAFIVFILLIINIILKIWDRLLGR